MFTGPSKECSALLVLKISTSDAALDHAHDSTLVLLHRSLELLRALPPNSGVGQVEAQPHLASSSVHGLDMPRSAFLFGPGLVRLALYYQSCCAASCLQNRFGWHPMSSKHAVFGSMHSEPLEMWKPSFLER